MFTINEDNSIYVTRGDACAFSVTAEKDGENYLFKAGDVLRIKVYGKKDAENVVLQKDFPVTRETETVDIILTEQDTKIGEVISKPKDYWYEVELNPLTNPQTIIGYDEEGARLFKLFPEGRDLKDDDPIIEPEDIPIVDKTLDLTSTRPVENQAIARAFVSLESELEKTNKVAEENNENLSKSVIEVKGEVAVERARINNLIAHDDSTSVSKPLEYLDFITENTKAKIDGTINSDGVYATIKVNFREANLIYGGSGTGYFIIPDECRPIDIGLIHTEDNLEYSIGYDNTNNRYYLSIYATNDVSVAPSSAGTVTISYALTESELKDIRVGADGANYSTAGEAIRSQVKSLSADTNNILSVLGDFVADESIDIQEGYYDKTNFYANVNFRSVRINVVKGEHYAATAFIRWESKWALVTFYDDSGNKISDSGICTEDTMYTNYEIVVPGNCAFFIVNGYVGRGASFEIKKQLLRDFATKDMVESRTPIGDGAFREVRCIVQNGYYGGTTFYAHGSYSSVKQDCKPGEIYRINTYIYKATGWPVAWLYKKDGTLIKTVGGLSENATEHGEQIIDYEFETPNECAFFITSNFNINDGVNFRIKRYEPDVLPLHNKNAIYLGDSITYISNGWRTEFNAVTGVNEIACTAVSGATICDYNDTVLNGTNFDGHQNTLSNQVQYLINNTPKEEIDFIIVAAGTNDHADASEFAGGITQFTNGLSYIDVDSVDRTRYDGAMRWIAEKLWGLFPNAVIFFCTPIQGAEPIRQTWVQLAKSDYMKEVAAHLGTPIIDATRKSGIYGRYENANASGKYLRDGLHLNQYGRVKLGRYYASEVINYFSYLK